MSNYILQLKMGISNSMMIRNERVPPYYIVTSILEPSDDNEKVIIYETAMMDFC